VKLGASKRDRLLDGVLSAVCTDFRSERRATTVSFNASAFGYEGLRQTPVVPKTLQGAPVYLSNCSSAPALASWQSWLVGTGTMLRLPWDSRINKPKPCTGLCLLTILRLYAQPLLCLSLGNARSSRQPYTILAQLELCSTRAMPKDQRRAGQFRSRLNFNATSGILRTTHHVSEFRRLLPEHRLGCGFWSNCSNVRTVLPKPCWSRLEANATACGETEPTLQSALRRYASEKDWPGYKRFVVSPGGPVPAPVLAAPGKDRLCMQPWRGIFQEGQAVTFFQCPRKSQGRAHKWTSASHFEWRMVPVLCYAATGCRPRNTLGTATDLKGRALAEETAGAEQPGVQMAMRIVPKSAPHLCLTAGALLKHGVRDTYRPHGVKFESLKQDYATRMKHIEEKRYRKEHARLKRLGGKDRQAQLEAKQRIRSEKVQQLKHDFDTRKARLAKKRRRKESELERANVASGGVRGA